MWQAGIQREGRMSCAWRKEHVELMRLLVLVLLVAAVGIGEYTGRVDLVEAQRAGCERLKQDRVDNAAGWRVAEGGRRRAALLATSPAEHDDALRNAEEWAAVAVALEKRSHVNCSEVYPDAPLLPFTRHHIKHTD